MCGFASEIFAGKEEKRRNPEEAHNQMFRDAFNTVQDTGSNQDFGTTKAAKMYFSLSNPGPNAFAGNEVREPAFAR